MKTLFVAMMICLSASAFGQVTPITPGAIAANEIDSTVWRWVLSDSYVLERVVIDTVTKCDTLYVPEGWSRMGRDGESVTYCRVEIRCKQVPRERVLWSVDIYGEVDIAGLAGLRVRKVPNNAVWEATGDTLVAVPR